MKMKMNTSRKANKSIIYEYGDELDWIDLEKIAN
jgi:hypothetical protein